MGNRVDSEGPFTAIGKLRREKFEVRLPGTGQTSQNAWRALVETLSAHIDPLAASGWWDLSGGGAGQVRSGC